MNLLILLLLGTLSAAASAEPQTAVVIVPVADVWSRPLSPNEKPLDELRETQVLFGEKVIIHESSGPWVSIEAVEQPEFTHHDRWEGYPGWVAKTDLTYNLIQANAVVKVKWLDVFETVNGGKINRFPLGSRIHINCTEKNWAQITLPGIGSGWVESIGLETMKPYLGSTSLPSKILKVAEFFLGDSYLWGGRSPAWASSPFFGVDCSGLVHLAYWTNGTTLPRDAHEQWMKAKPITRAQLKPADLIFSAKADTPKKITHVALYAGDGQIIEAPQTGMVVRKISFKEKYGKDFERVESGDKVGDRVVYFGSYLQH